MSFHTVMKPHMKNKTVMIAKGPRKEPTAFAPGPLAVGTLVLMFDMISTL